MKRYVISVSRNTREISNYVISSRLAGVVLISSGDKPLILISPLLSSEWL
jgi:hypothetical protein